MPLPPFSYRRWPTRVVMVGDVGVGGDQPIRVQSMTTPATTDVKATVDQVERLVDAGCELVRVTVPSKSDAEALPLIRAELAARRLRVPLIADIHFTPAAAMMAVEHVEKVRVNPGNYADKKRFEQRDYTDAEYRTELDRIRDKFLPLVRRARERGVSMRIGTNHGSLSDRIMNRFGDTPQGMVESALEFVRIARDDGYHELILSMKSSNPLVAIEAYRLLVQQMEAEQMDYPLHLGVTEAGDGEDGRIKSAVGIGALLDEGLGDTVRVSLTEDPVAEVPVAFALVAPYNQRIGRDLAQPTLVTTPPPPSFGFGRGRRPTSAVPCGPHVVGGGEPVRTEVRLRTPVTQTRELHLEIATVAGYTLPAEKKSELLILPVASAVDAAAVVELAGLFTQYSIPVPLAVELTAELVVGHVAGTIDLGPLLEAAARVAGLPPSDLDERRWCDAVEHLARAAASHSAVYLLECAPEQVPSFLASALPTPHFEGPVEAVVRAVELARAAGARVMAGCWTDVFPGPTAAMRLLAARLDALGLDVPLVASHRLADDQQPLLQPAIHLGSLLADGLADQVRRESNRASASIDPNAARSDVRFLYDLLQATRQRIVKTEFISCPSCGRTLFDLEQTTARIKARTAHLKGLRIAIMGCVVNGPGEMADADFGYVGWGPGKIALFAGREMVMKDIPTANADERLVELIRAHGRWVDP